MKDFLELQHKRIELPVFVPSISGSSVPEENLWNLRRSIIEAIANPRHHSVMVSAYDFTHPNQIFSDIGEAIVRGRSVHEAFGLSNQTVVYIDSGGYELTRRGEEPDDPMDVYTFETIARGDVVVILDFPTDAKLSPENNNIRITKTIQFARKVAECHDGKATLMAVAHGYDESSLLECAAQLANIDGIAVIGIPAREPFGLASERKLRTVQRVSSLTTSCDSEKIVHILGTTKMRLLPFYVACGASSFDGTNWIARTADPTRLTWVSRQSKAQSSLSQKCQCEWCESLKSTSISETCSKGASSRMNHNLCSLDLFMETIKNHLKRKTLHEYCQRTHPALFRKLTELENASQGRKR